MGRLLNKKRVRTNKGNTPSFGPDGKSVPFGKDGEGSKIADKAAMTALISGKRRFAQDIEDWISNEAQATGKTRRQILEESVHCLMDLEATKARKKTHKTPV